MPSTSSYSQSARLLEGFYIANVALCIFFLGSASAPPFLLMCGSMAVIAIVSVFIFNLRTARRFYFLWATAAMFFLFVYALLQALNDGPAPGDVRMALLGIVYPLMTYAAGLLICRSRDRAEGWLEWLGLFGAFAAMVGVVQLQFFPTDFIYGVKRYYVDSLTSFFVNRNTTATFLGISLLIQTLFAYRRIRDGFAKYRKIGKAYEVRLFLQVCIYGACLSITMMALLLTKSRGGIVSTGVALVFLIPYLVVRQFRDRFTSVKGWRTSVLFTGVSLATLLVLSLFSGRVIYRIMVSGTADGRFCIAPAAWRAGVDHWMTGLGFGSFPVAFPTYRPAECGIGGVWNRAHNFFLEIFFTGGLPIVLLVVATLGALLLMLLSTIRYGGRRNPFAALGIACLMLLVIHSFIDFSLQIPGVAVFASAAFVAITAICTEPRTRMTASSDRSKAEKRVRNRDTSSWTAEDDPVTVASKYP